MKTNRSNKLFDQTRIATLGLQDLLAFGQLQPDGTYKVRNVTNSNFLNAIVISEQITYAEILALATASELVAGKNYTITNAVSGTLSLYIFAVSTSKLAEYGYETTTGQVYSYDLATDTATNADNTGYINFTPQTAPAYQRGRVWYDSTTETLSVYDDISGTSVQLGQEEILRARNSTGSTILNGAVVYVSGAQGQNPRVSLALANAESTSRVIGVATHNISNNSVGKITTFGIVGDLNTSAYNEGDVLYLSASVAGGLTTTRPSAPNQAVMVGTVIHAAVNDGKILVHTDNYGIGFGTANQVRGMNAAGTAEEYKTIQGTASEVEVLHTANTVTIGLPNAVTISGAMTAGSFVKSGGVSAQFLKADGTVDANAYFYTNAQVTGQALTGLSVSGSAVVSTDSILTGIGKLQNQINAVLGSVNFQGVWNASTNSPSLASGVGTKGYYYIVSVAGSTNLDGITDWKLGDWAIYDGSAWQKVDNTDAVVSVNGYTGIVTLAAADVGALPTSAISGTTGKLAKFTSSGAVGDSIVSESGSAVILTGQYLVATDSSFLGYFGKSSVLVSSTSANDTAIFTPNNFNIGTGSSNILRLQVKSNGQIITNSATDTGEAHIFGGSARVNGNMDIRSSNTFFGSQQGYVYILEDQINSYYSTNAEATLNINYFGYNQGATQFRNFRVFDGKTNPLFYIQGSTGNVGIGITSPAYKLSINGNAGIEASEEYFYFHSDYAVGSNARGKIRAVGAGGGSGFGGDLRFSSRASNNAWNEDVLVINSSGNVLIGTTTDDGVNKLQVSGNTSVAGILTLNMTAGNYPRLITTVGAKSWEIGYRSGTTSYELREDGTTRLSFADSTGAATFSSNVDINGTTLNLGNNTIIDSYTGNSSTYRVLVLTDQTANTNIGLNYNPISNVGSAFNGTGQIFIAHNKGIIASNAAGNNYIGVLRPISTGVYFGGSLSSGELAGDGLFISTTGAATFSSSVTATSFTAGGRTRVEAGQIVDLGGAGNNTGIFFGSGAIISIDGSGNATVKDLGTSSFRWGKIFAQTINLSALPTSASGLSTGDIWNDGGTLKIV